MISVSRNDAEIHKEFMTKALPKESYDLESWSKDKSNGQDNEVHQKFEV